MATGEPMSGIDSSWNVQAVTALDLSAMAASENIVNASQDTQRSRSMERDDFHGGTNPPLLGITELSANITASDGPAYPLHVAGSPTDYDSGLIIPVASTSEGSVAERASEYLDQSQMDRAFSSNLAARAYVDSYVGAIVDCTA